MPKKRNYKIQPLQEQMNALLSEYGDKISEVIEEVLPNVCKQTVSYLHNESPKRTEDYAASWSFKRQGKDRGKYTFHGYTVYNEKHYRLTHLLEYGHVSRNGGRVKAYPHIAKAEEEAGEILEREVRKAISQIK